MLCQNAVKMPQKKSSLAHYRGNETGINSVDIEHYIRLLSQHVDTLDKLNTDGKVRFCEEVASVTNGHFQLILHDTPTPPHPNSLVSVSVQFNARDYGILYCSSNEPSAFTQTFSLEDLEDLACICGWRLWTIEQMAPLIKQMDEQTTPKLIRLTKQEQKILDLMRQGNDQSVIAKKLGIDVKTVKVHKRYIFAKLGVHKANDAILLAQFSGYFTSRQNPSSSKKTGIQDRTGQDIALYEDYGVKVDMLHKIVACWKEQHGPTSL